MLARDSFFVHGTSSDESASDFTFSMRLQTELESGKYEVGLLELSFPLATTIKESDDAYVIYKLIERRTISGLDPNAIVVHEKYAVKHQIPPGSYSSVQAMIKELNDFRPMLRGDSGSNKLDLKKYLEWLCLGNSRRTGIQTKANSTTDSVNQPSGGPTARIERGVRISLSPGLQALAGLNEPDDFDLLNKTEIANLKNKTPVLINRLSHRIYVECNIIEDVETKATAKKIIRIINQSNLYLQKGMHREWTSSSIQYHRVNTSVLSRFRIRLLDHRGDPLKLDSPVGSNDFDGNTFFTLHFRKIGFGFQGRQPDDKPIKAPHLITSMNALAAEENSRKRKFPE